MARRCGWRGWSSAAGTSHRERFLSLTFEVDFGLTNVIVRPDVRERYCWPPRSEPILVIDGRLQQDDGIINVLAEEIRTLGTPIEAVIGALAHSHDFRQRDDGLLDHWR